MIVRTSHHDGDFGHSSGSTMTKNGALLCSVPMNAARYEQDIKHIAQIHDCRIDAGIKKQLRYHYFSFFFF